jgi:hypothetical protein
MFLLASEERGAAMAGPTKKRERGRAGAVLCPLCEGKTCRGCGMRSHWFGGKSNTRQEDGMGRKRKRKRERSWSSSNAGRKRRKCGYSKGEGEGC